MTGIPPCKATVGDSQFRYTRRFALRPMWRLAAISRTGTWSRDIPPDEVRTWPSPTRGTRIERERLHNKAFDPKKHVKDTLKPPQR